ncbi:MAG: nucleotidyltransferase family protein [Phycisphaerae bacterium]
MVAIIENEMERVAALCREHRVHRLEVFGSAADGTFDPGRSDLDFLVEYEPMSPAEHYDAYFGLWEGLAALFQRKVDLVEPHTMRNPYFIREVNATRKIVYAA